MQQVALQLPLRVTSGGRGEHGPASGLPLPADMTKACAVFGLGPAAESPR